MTDTASNRHLPVTILCVVALLLLVAPTLTWLEFSSGSENLNVATVLEMKREGSFIKPTLNGELRVNKPPLTAWFTSLFVRESTVERLSNRNALERARAFDQLAREVRWPLLVCMFVFLMGVYEMGRQLVDGRTGFAAAMVALSTVMFLRFFRAATTDVQLAMWVTWTNVFLILAILRGRTWSGFLGAGVFAGLMMMSKGPVGLVQTLVPMAVIGFLSARGRSDDARTARPPMLGPAILGTLIALSIALPWPVKVLMDDPSILSTWRSEITRENATDLPADPVWAYGSLLLLLMPWLAMFVVGLFMVRASRVVLYCAILVLVPIVIMSLFKDKNERYLLPMLAPSAVMIALAALHLFRGAGGQNRGNKLILGFHWGTLFLIAIGLPLAGWITLRTVTDDPWWPAIAAAATATFLSMLLILGIIVSVGRPLLMFVTTALFMTLASGLFMWGYRDSREGRAELLTLCQRIWARAPQATVYHYDPPRAVRKPLPIELSIYLNRIIHPIDSPAQVRAGERDRVLVMLVRRNESEPPIPPGYEEFTRVDVAGRKWIAMIGRPVSQ